MAAKKLSKKEQRVKNVEASKGRLTAMSGMSRAQRIDSIVRAHPDTVRRASSYSTSYMLRRPTGILGLDLGLGGGFPAGATSVIWGPDGVGKDYLLWRTLAESQRIFGEDFAACVYLTEFLTDKRYIRDRCGLKIGLTDGEIDEINLILESRGRPHLTDEQAWHYQEKVGEIITITGSTAEVGFDRIMDFVQSNAMQIVAVNSIGFLYTEVKEAAESFADNPQQRNEAIALTKFITKMSTILNRGGPGGERNETSTILINQARSKDAAPMGRAPTEKEKMKSAADVWALKHGKAIDLRLHSTERLYPGGKTTLPAIGRKKTWELMKGKLGTHEGKKGEFDYYFKTGADVVADLIDTAIALGVVDAGGGGNYEFEGMKFRGRATFAEEVRDNEGLAIELRESCLKKTPVVFRTS